MPDVTLTRFLKADLAVVFDHISKPENVLQWWGPVGVDIAVHDLSLGQLGPWMSEMHSKEGSTYKVSGQVTRVDPPHLIGFTWAWHDDDDKRRHESHVTIELTPKDGGTQFTLRHVDLADAESATNHTTGWTSSVSKLETLFNG